MLKFRQRRLLPALALALGTLPILALAAGTGYNMTYVGGVKTVIMPPETAAFAPGPNVDLVTATCGECHSVDYPTTQAPQDWAGWLAVMDKMQNNYGMEPLSNSDQSMILEYLTTYYGK